MSDLYWILVGAAIIAAVTYVLRMLRLKERKGSFQLKIINRYRRRNGLKPLRTYYELDSIARGHSRYMARHHTCNHDGFSQRAKRVQQVTGSGSAGENCYQYPAKGYNHKVAIGLVRGWMHSPGHRANLLNPSFSKMGIGIAQRGKYVYATQLFSG
jgi:uncharacterized protein YkwD